MPKAILVQQPIRIIIIMCITVFALPSIAQAASLGCADNSAKTEDRSSYNADILSVTNKHRQDLGLVALKLDPLLSKAALWKAQDMATRNYFSHDDLNAGGVDRSPWQRLSDCGFTTPLASFAENIAAGQTSGEAFAEAWIASPGHRKNIETPSFRYIGIATTFTDNSTYGTYSVQMFSSKSSGVTEPTPPPAPTTTSIEIIPGDAAYDLCPPINANYAYQSIGSVTGAEVQVGNTSDGCLTISAPEDLTSGQAAVLYRSVLENSFSKSIKLTINVVNQRSLTSLNPNKITTTLLGSTTSIRSTPCKRTLCTRITVTARLKAKGGRVVSGQKIYFNRINSQGKTVRIGSSKTNKNGVATLSMNIRLSKRSLSHWLANNWRLSSITYIGTQTFAPCTKKIRPKTA